MSWYCVINGERRGPITWEELCACAGRGELRADDDVWTADFGGSWKRAGEVTGLIPPPLDPPAAADVLVVPIAAGMPPLSPDEHAPSCVQALHEAWQRMAAVLFKPFDVALWFGIGLCAWLASVGRNDWINRLNLSGLPDILRTGFETGGWQAVAEYASGAVQERLAAVLTLSAVAWTALLALVMMWIRARGAFVLIDRWHRPRASFTESWRALRTPGRSLFVFRLMLTLGFAAVLGAWIGLGFPLQVFEISAWRSFAALRVLWAGGFLLTVVAWAVAAELDGQFVVPVMYWRQRSAADAWRVVLSFCNRQPVAVIRFLVMRIALATAVGLGAILGAALTCCLLWVVLAIPYLGSVVFLPVTFFFRGLGPSYVRQWKPELSGRVPGGQ